VRIFVRVKVLRNQATESNCIAFRQIPDQLVSRVMYSGRGNGVSERWPVVCREKSRTRGIEEAGGSGNFAICAGS